MYYWQAFSLLNCIFIISSGVFYFFKANETFTHLFISLSILSSTFNLIYFTRLFSSLSLIVIILEEVLVETFLFFVILFVIVTYFFSSFLFFMLTLSYFFFFERDGIFFEPRGR